MGSFRTGGNGYESSWCQGDQSVCWPVVKRITFSRAFTTVPNVQVMLGDVEASNGAYIRVYTRAESVTKTGFQAKAWTINNSLLFYVRLVWIACGE